jgi:hypothetical protein
MQTFTVRNKGWTALPADRGCHHLRSRQQQVRPLGREGTRSTAAARTLPIFGNH